MKQKYTGTYEMIHHKRMV